MEYAKTQEIVKTLKTATTGTHAIVTRGDTGGKSYHVRTHAGRLALWVNIFTGDAQTSQQMAERAVKHNDTVSTVNAMSLKDLLSIAL